MDVKKVMSMKFYLIIQSWAFLEEGFEVIMIF